MTNDPQLITPPPVPEKVVVPLSRKRKIWITIAILILITIGILIWLFFKPKDDFQPIDLLSQAKFHEYPGEELVDFEQAPPISGSNAVCGWSYRQNRTTQPCKTWELKISFDKPYISPIPGAEITAHIELWEEGKKITPEGIKALKTPQSAYDSKGVDVFAYVSVVPLRPLFVSSAKLISGDEEVRIDLGDIDRNYNNKPWGETWFDDHGSALVTPNKSRWLASSSYVYSAQMLAPPNLVDPDNDPRSRGSYPFTHQHVFLDLSTGEADLTFVSSGIRSLPYVVFDVLMPIMFTDRDDKDLVRTVAPVLFEDQIHSERQVVNNLKAVDKTIKGDFFYGVDVTPVTISKNGKQTVQLNITSRKPNGRINTDTFQKVKVMAYPAESGFQAELVKDVYEEHFDARSDTNIIGDILNRGIWTDAATQRVAAFWGSLNLTTSGGFRQSDETSESADDGQSIEVMLQSGEATVEYEYNGTPGWHSALIFQIAPVTAYPRTIYSCPYLRPSGSQDPKCLEDLEELYKTLPELPEEVTTRASKSLLAEYILSGDKWYKRGESGIKAYTLKTVPIR